MNIEYANKSMEHILEDEKLIRKHYGFIETKLINRMSDLRIARNLSQVSQLPPPRRHKLTGNWKGCWGIDLSKNHRLVIRPMGSFELNNLATITDIKIEAIEDYH